MRKLAVKAFLPLILTTIVFMNIAMVEEAYGDLQQAVQDVLDADAEKKVEEYESRLQDPLYPGDLISNVPTFDESNEAFMPDEENCDPKNGEGLIALHNVMTLPTDRS